MAELFPSLAADPSADPSIIGDLLLTEAQFGAKYRKGKSARLAELDNQNMRLAFEALRAEESRNRKILRDLNAALVEAGGDLHSLLAMPRTESQAVAVFRLWFLTSLSGSAGSTLSLDSLREGVESLGFDELDTRIARKVILAVGTAESVAELAEAVRLSRQSIYARLRKVADRLTELGSGRDFTPLVDAVLRAGETRGGLLRLPAHHPLIAIAPMHPAGPFGHVVDLVRLAVWTAASSLQGGDARELTALQLRMLELDGRTVLEVS